MQQEYNTNAASRGAHSLYTHVLCWSCSLRSEIPTAETAATGATGSEEVLSVAQITRPLFSFPLPVSIERACYANMTTALF